MTAVWLETRGIIYLVLYVVLILPAGRQGARSGAQQNCRRSVLPRGLVGMARPTSDGYLSGGRRRHGRHLDHADSCRPTVEVGAVRPRPGTPWSGMLIYTVAWLWSLRPIQPLESRPDLGVITNVHIGMRAIVLALMFFFAIASIENW